MPERKIYQHPPVIFVWTDQMYRKYKLRLVYLSSALRAVRHTHLARTACISLQHGNIAVGYYPKIKKYIYKNKLNE